MGSFSFDIETRPLLDLVDAEFERKEFVDKPLRNTWQKEETWILKQQKYADELNLRVRDHEEAENKRYQELLGKATLDASQSEVLCISYCDNDDNSVHWAPERKLLEELWHECYQVQCQAGRVFSCSSSQFDIRFCYRRSLALGIKFPVSLRLVQFKGARAFLDGCFVDLAEVWVAGEPGRRISVNRLARAFGVDPKLEGDVNGANFWRKFEELGREAVEPYALRDSAVVWEVAHKMMQCGIFKFEVYRAVAT